MTILAPSADYTGAAVTQGGKKTFISTMRTFLADLFGSDSALLRTAHETLRINGPGVLQNLKLTPSVAANALTMTVQTRAGATPTPADPVLVSVRNATAGSGDSLLRQVSAALSLVISSGSTMGHTSAVAGTIYWYLVDSDGAGVMKLAASSTYYGPHSIGTTVAEGGAGAADSASVIYADAVYAAKAMRLIGKSVDTQTTAGTWAANLTRMDPWPFDAPVEIAQNSQSVAYTTVLADANKHILHPSADTTARTFTIDSNANVPYVIGTPITFVNQNAGGVISIAITTDTMRLAGAGTTGVRTLAANGIATALKIKSTEWIISGTGLT